MAYAIHIKTQSGDDYMFAFDGNPLQKDVCERIKDYMEEEVEYIDDWHEDGGEVDIIAGLRKLGCELDNFQ